MTVPSIPSIMAVPSILNVASLFPSACTVSPALPYTLPVPQFDPPEDEPLSKDTTNETTHQLPTQGVIGTPKCSTKPPGEFSTPGEIAQLLTLKSPLKTPLKRTELLVTTKDTGEIHVSTRGCFSKRMHQLSKEHRFAVYSGKLEIDVVITLPDGSQKHETIVKRIIGATAAGLIQRAQQYVADLNSQKGSTTTSAAAKKILEEHPNASIKFSFGLLALPKNAQDLDKAESRAIEKGKITYGNSILNKRKGGGGGSSIQEEPTLSDAKARSKLDFLINKMTRWTDLTRDQGIIRHTLPKEQQETKPALYIFKVTKNGEEKCNVGITQRKAQARIREHLYFANHPERSHLEDKTFYTDLHNPSTKVKLGIVDIQPLLKKGATTMQLEKIANAMLHSRRNPDGSGGYNLNSGGGGGASKK